MKNLLEHQEDKNIMALLPIFVFIVLFVGSGIITGDFYAMPAIVAFLVALSFFIPKEDIDLPAMSKIEIDRSHFLKRVFLGVDYFLLLTFIALFILIGNLENIPFFNELFKTWIVGNEVLWGVIASQFISNVPSAILLSGFSTNYEAIIIGINIGGLGTLIASMANLISYKILIREHDEFKMRYLIVFTVLNVILLFILLGTYVLIN
jgi:Na+/H+ antiporter NhaD/arsenite permease-like protein